MKRFLATVSLSILAFACLPAASVAATDSDPRLKIFAGYSIVPTTKLSEIKAGAVEKQGVTGSAALRLLGGLSLKFDFTNVNAPGNAKLFLVGPEFRIAKYSHAEVFVHGLFGAIKSADTVGQNTEVGPVTIRNTSGAVALGGGFDLDITKRFGVRVIQFDYLRGAQVASLTKNGFRASAGLVVKF